jgi:single-strand selective monofunctional uracil DNA glycosylase
MNSIIDDLVAELRKLQFGSPVTHVYNPLEYARGPYDQYVKKYGNPPKEAVFVGMNPGPWGMAQTGIPFGEVEAVETWLGIRGRVSAPSVLHPKRPVHGFACKRSEVSGRRLWGWARETFVTPERFFARFFVANYCPLFFIEESGRNRTPDKIPAAERRPLLSACDEALRRTVQWLRPRYVVGVGEFVKRRCMEALSGLDVDIGRITHPSPANPNANRGWRRLVESELLGLGIRV